MKQYEIWWARLPDPAGERPVLLVSRDQAYEHLSKFVVAEITTTVRGNLVEVPVGSSEGLPKLCVVNCDNLHTVARFRLVRRMGRIEHDRWWEVKRALGYAFHWEELIGAQG